jgi:outer membrane protein assembly factor BamB
MACRRQADMPATHRRQSPTVPRAQRAPATLALVLALGLAACSSTSDKAAKPTPLVPIAAPIDVHRPWTYDIGNSEDTFLRPGVLENAIYVAARRGDLARIDPTTGKEAWRVRVDGGITGGVGSDGLLLAVAGPRGNVVAFDVDGKKLWEAQASSDVIAPPLVGHGLVIVRSTDNRITAYQAKDGARLWVFQKQQPALSLRAESEMVFSGDSVLVGFPGGRLGAIALSNGAGRWEAGVSEPKGATEVERLADVLGAPQIVGDDVCTASYQGRIGCFDARSGDLRWAREFSAGTGIAAAGGTVIGVDSGSRISAFARASGASLWQNGALGNRGLSPPVIVGKYVAVGDFEGRIHFLRLEDGRIVGRVDADAGPVISTPQTWNGAGVFQTSRGKVLVLAPPGG